MWKWDHLVRYISFCPGSDLPRVWAVPQDLHPEARERQVRKRYVAPPPLPPLIKGDFFTLNFFVCGGDLGSTTKRTFEFPAGGGGEEYYFWGDELVGKL